MKLVSTYLIGLIFGIGISISGMGNAAKVINFFDIFGTWDPSLIFVMMGAMITTMIGYRFVLKRPHPIFASKFHLPTRTDLDARLITGAVIFGIGWGIAGFCPGGALPMVGTFRPEVLIFTAALIAGIFFAKWLQNRKSAKPAKA